MRVNRWTEEMKTCCFYALGQIQEADEIEKVILYEFQKVGQYCGSAGKTCTNVSYFIMLRKLTTLFLNSNIIYQNSLRKKNNKWLYGNYSYMGWESLLPAEVCLFLGPISLTQKTTQSKHNERVGHFEERRESWSWTLMVLKDQLHKRFNI